MSLLYLVTLFSLTCVLTALILPKSIQLPSVGLITAVFLLVIDPLSFSILFTSSVGVYYSISKLPHRHRVVSIVVCALGSVLLIFKLNNLNLFQDTLQTAIPLGMSYYMFRQIHYAFEAMKETLPKHSLGDYLSYLFFIPTLIVGPIHRFPDFLRDKHRRRWNSEQFSLGIEQILYGYAKIIVLGNYLIVEQLGGQVEALYAAGSTRFAAYLDAFAFTLNAYFQFAGYSSIAVGLSAMLGFNIIENFNFPLTAKNIGDFWKRWHISLSSWCGDYVYTPIVSMTRKPFVAIFASMAILGLWHEVSLRYIAWAFVHVCAIYLWRKVSPFTQALAKRSHMHRLFCENAARLLTLHFVVFSFILVKGNDWHDVAKIFTDLF